MAPRPTRHETSAGAVVFHRSTGAPPRYLLILDAHGNWGFPKGHVEGRESLVETARREVCEETGLAEVIDHGSLGERRWRFAAGPDQVEKRCHYFLFEADEMTAEPQASEGISQVAWLRRDEADRRLSFDQARALLAEADTALEMASAEE